MVVLHAPPARDNSVMNLAICIGGIYICYLSYGIFQEKMYAPKPAAERNAALSGRYVRC